MLARWRLQIQIAVTPAQRVNAHDPVAYQTVRGIVPVAAREAADTRFKPQAAMTKTRPLTAKAPGAMASRPPAAVATPLPPVRNFKKTG